MLLGGLQTPVANPRVRAAAGRVAVEPRAEVALT